MHMHVTATVAVLAYPAARIKVPAPIAPGKGNKRSCIKKGSEESKYHLMVKLGLQHLTEHAHL